MVPFPAQIGLPFGVQLSSTGPGRVIGFVLRTEPPNGGEQFLVEFATSRCQLILTYAV